MKCKRCKAVAVVALPSHTTGFCAECFLLFFQKQVERGIKAQKLFTHDDKILCALSGGKDSLSLMLILHELGYDVTALHIDLGIPSSSPKARLVVENFCKKHDFKLIIREMEKEGLALPEVKKHLKRPICSVCGKIKRHYFNRIGLEEGFTALATGHNLDDEVARLFSNVLRWDTAYLSDQGPCLPSENGFLRKVKPMWRLTEYEIANYAFLKDIENHYAPCPYSRGASFSFHKTMWQQLEQEMPGRKIEFYQGFMHKAKEYFAKADAEHGATLIKCPSCGYPTSQELCGVCRIKSLVEQAS